MAEIPWKFVHVVLIAAADFSLYMLKFSHYVRYWDFCGGMCELKLKFYSFCNWNFLFGIHGWEIRDDYNILLFMIFQLTFFSSFLEFRCNPSTVKHLPYFKFTPSFFELWAQYFVDCSNKSKSTSYLLYLYIDCGLNWR